MSNLKLLLIECLTRPLVCPSALWRGLKKNKKVPQTVAEDIGHIVAHKEQKMKSLQTSHPTKAPHSSHARLYHTVQAPIHNKLFTISSSKLLKMDKDFPADQAESY